MQSTITINFNTITILFHIVSFIFLSFFKSHTQTYQFSPYEENTPKIARDEKGGFFQMELSDDISRVASGSLGVKNLVSVDTY